MNSFLDYLSPAGNNLIAEWYCGLSIDARAMFDDILDVLSKQAEWKYPQFKRLEDGLGEIRWKCDNKQHRVIGCWWKTPHGFLLLIGCFHKQNVYNPPDAIETAAKRRRGLQFGGKGGTREHQSPEDCAPQE
jgi:hypothetical protein